MSKEPIKSKESYTCGGGAICGGVISKTLFDSEPMAYMMSYYMEDKWFEEYKAAKEKGDDKAANKLFDRYAMSAI